jgi:hypothetical protein
MFDCERSELIDGKSVRQVGTRLCAGQSAGISQPTRRVGRIYHRISIDARNLLF